MFARLMGLKVISPNDLFELEKQQQVSIFDVNSRQSWDRAHVPGAANLDANEFGAQDLPPDKRASIVFYCSNPMCRKAPNAARRAKQMGYENVRVMSAGIKGWLSSGLPTEKASEA